MTRARIHMYLLPAALMMALALVAAACTPGGPTQQDKPALPAEGGPAVAVPPAAAPAAPAPAGGLWAKPPIGTSWPDYFGIVEEAKLDAGGPGR